MENEKIELEDQQNDTWLDKDSLIAALQAKLRISYDLARINDLKYKKLEAENKKLKDTIDYLAQP